MGSFRKITRDAWEKKSEQERVKIIFDVVEESLGNYEKDHPDGAWLPDTAMEITTGGLASLRAYVEDPAEMEITWKAPVVELRYPVEWSWEKDQGAPWGRQLSAIVTPADIADLEAATSKISELSRNHRHLYALETLTKGVIECREQATANPDGNTSYSLPQAIVEELNEATGTWYDPETEERKGPEDRWEIRRWLIDELARPFIIGAIEIDGEDIPEESGEALDQSIIDLIIGGTKDLPSIDFKVTLDNGETYSGTVVVCFYPMVVDADRQEAFYPVQVQLHFHQEDAEPWTWPEADRQGLWEILLKEVGGETLPAPHAGPASKAPRLILDGHTRKDKNASKMADIIMGGLPKKFASIPTWESLVEQEIKSHLDNFGDLAMEDMRAATGSESARGPLLKTEGWKDGKPIYHLTKEAEEGLIGDLTGKVYRRTVLSANRVPQECIIRRFRVGKASAEIRFSWYNMAWPLSEDLANNDLMPSQGTLFDELEPEKQTELNKALDKKLRFLRSFSHARKVMAFVLNKMGSTRENPVRIAAYEFYGLLECEGDKNKLKIVEGCLEALRHMDYHVTTKGTRNDFRGSGSFLGEYKFKNIGTGGAGEGEFLLTVMPGFVGSLELFSTGKRNIKGDDIKTLDWGKRLSKDEKKELKEGGGFIHDFTCLGPFLPSSHNFTNEQEKLRGWAANQITPAGTAVSKYLGDQETRKKDRPRSGTDAAKAPRVYKKENCPLLDGRKNYHGALGSFKNSPESGWTFEGGLLEAMGLPVPPKGSETNRRMVVEMALENLHTVINWAMGGVVAARHKKEWLTLEDASRLPLDALISNVTWFPFPAHNWKDIILEAFNEYQQGRFDRGETPDLLQATTDRKKYERSQAEIKGEHFQEDQEAPQSGLNRLSLHLRFHVAWKDSRLSQQELADVLGVAKMTISKWLRGPENGGRPIPKGRIDQIEAWIKDTGEPEPE